MGACIGVSSDKEKQINKLRMLITRLRSTVPVQLLKIQTKIRRQQNDLYNSFIKQKSARIKPFQTSLIQHTIFLQNMSHVWKVIQNSCSKILDYFKLLQTSENIKHIQNDLQTFLFIKSMLNNSDLNSISFILSKKFGIVEPQKIDNQIVNHHKNTNSITDRMINDYIMLFCQNKQIKLDKINQNGHNFKY